MNTLEIRSMSHILHPICETTPIKPDSPEIVVEVLRSSSNGKEESSIQRYVVPYINRMSVFTILREIYENQDPTLAFRTQQCGRGICGICRVSIDLDRLGWKNKNVKGCSVVLEPGDCVVIRPLSNEKVIRDLASR
jgi:succinate dehydrogenase/fumarate reductase-like Fe-S protein